MNIIPSTLSPIHVPCGLEAALESALALVGHQEPQGATLPVSAPPDGFTAWLTTQEERRDPVGSLAYDVTRDPTWPGDVPVLAMFDYLTAEGAIPAALAALHSAWTEWAVPNEMRNYA